MKPEDRKTNKDKMRVNITTAETRWKDLMLKKILNSDAQVAYFCWKGIH